MNASERSIRSLISLVSVLPKLILLSRKSYYDYLKRLTSNKKLIEVLSTLWEFGGLPSKRLLAPVFLMIFGDYCRKENLFPKDGQSSHF